MSLERLAVLAGAWGGEVARWPDEERAAARAALREEPLAARRLLAEAAKLDRLLAKAPSPAPSAALTARIVMAAPARARPARWRWLAGAAVGAGLAAASAAGLAAGDRLAPLAVRPATAPADPSEDAVALLREPPDLAAEG